MKTFRLLACFVLFTGSFPFAHAGGGENSERLSVLKALSFTKAKSVSVAKLSVPPAGRKPDFRGCFLASEWRPVVGQPRDDLVALLQQIVNDQIAIIAKDPDATFVFLQPFGFVTGDYAVRVETDKGTREFAVCLPSKWDGYLYCYAGKRQSLGLSPGANTMAQFAIYRPE